MSIYLAAIAIPDTIILCLGKLNPDKVSKIFQLIPEVFHYIFSKIRKNRKNNVKYSINCGLR